MRLLSWMAGSPPFDASCWIPPLVWLCLSLAGLSQTAAASASFTWEASIDRCTGIATSREFSVVRIEGDTKNDAKRKAETSSAIPMTSKNLVASWADFLCQGRITLGLLQAKHDTSAGTASLHVRGFSRFPLLTFGSVRELKPSQAWELPIMSAGFLALPSAEDDDLSQRPKYFGSLRFECRQRRPSAAVKPAPRHHRSSSRGISITRGVGEDDEKQLFTTLELESHIVDFRPWLAGKSLPISRARKFLYLQTQSRVHAYVTWRFHNAWRDALLREVSSKETKTTTMATTTTTTI